jgi:hypothetical protein
MSTVMDRSQINMRAVELAARSPDQRVRGAAMRRLEIENEIAPLDSFLSYYCDEADRSGVEVKQAAVPVTKKPTPATGEQKGKTIRMIEVARDAIVAYGRPMSLSVLFETMRRDHPAVCLASQDSMRARLAEHKDKLVRVDGRGYWPAGMEPPSADV